MSVKKSRTTRKPSGTGQQKASSTNSLDKGEAVEAQSPTAEESATQGAPVQNLSSRASRKVAAEKGAEADKRGEKSTTYPAQSGDEKAAVARYLPSRRVWPD